MLKKRLAIVGAALLLGFPALRSGAASLLASETGGRAAKDLIVDPDPAEASGSIAQSAQIVAFCPSGCGIPVNIGAVSNKGRRPGGGHDVEAHWQRRAAPSDTLLREVVVTVEVTLQGGRVQRGSKGVARDAKVAVVAAKGLATDGDPKSYKVTITTICDSIPRDLFEITELRPANFRAGGGMDVLVTWRALRASPCDSTTDYEVVVTAKKFASEKQGKERVRLSQGTTLVKLPPPKIGGSWDETVNLRAVFNPLNRQPIICSTSRSGDF